ncbi:MAG: peptide chain release factor-like protein [Planctomycetes bacterium]|nr:peptide chain release factor-like protein [Planctomycetota bacterium]
MNHVRDELLSMDDRSLLDACQVHTYRASGPGGQKRNKTDSAVRLRHGPSGLTVVATESRSQHENRARALRRIRLAMALQMRTPVQIDSYEPSPVVTECVSARAQLRVGRRDGRYHRIVAEVLDVLAACSCRVSTAAGKIGITTANLVAFLHKDLKLWRRVNEMREADGLKRLQSKR